MDAIKWVKITVDMFDNRKIRHMRRMTHGDSVALMWVMLITMAGRCNDGGLIYLTEDIPYTVGMLADETGFDEGLVRASLAAMESLRMIETTDRGYIRIIGWSEYQSADRLDSIREQNRIRKQRYDAKQKMLVTSNVTSNVTVTASNATDIDIDKEKEKEKEKEINDIVAYLNEKSGKQFRPHSKTTRQLIRARMTDGYTLEDFRKVIDTKCLEWIGTRQEGYLRPETLFGAKFEGYLQQRNVTALQAERGVKKVTEQAYTQREYTDVVESAADMMKRWQDRTGG